MKYLSFFVKSRSQKSKIDKLFLLCVIVLSLLGTTAVFSSGYAYAKFRYSDEFYFIKRQIIWLLLGFVVLAIAKNIDLKILRYCVPYLYLTTIVLLILTLIIGFVGNGAQRWISIGPITIQPSEIAKFTVILALADYYEKFEKRTIESDSNRDIFIYGTLIPFLILLLPIVLVMLQKHLSCIIILGTIGILLMVASGINLKYLYSFLGMGICGVLYIALFTDYTKERILVWRNPELYKLTGGWQTLQGLMAIGSGGLFGKGLTHGELKYCYVSEPANDMIFAVLCEETGFVGGLTVIFLFAFLIYRGIKIALRCKTTFERLLVCGICIKTAVQVLLNIAVVTNTIPNTGISLPFFSYGGSSLVMLFFEVGIVLSASKN